MDWGAEPPTTDFAIGVDVAQGGADYTAIAVLERVNRPLPEYAVTWLERWRDRRTARIPERVHAISRRLTELYRTRVYAATGSSPRDLPAIQLVVDQTGVGPFALDPLRAAGLDPIGIVIHGGDAVAHPDSRTYRVPKRDLAGAIHVLLESGRLSVAAAIPEAVALRAELENFRAKITLAGHDRWEAGPGEEWRVGAHDDLVLAVAVAAWLCESRPTPTLDPLIVAAWTDLPREVSR